MESAATTEFSDKTQQEQSWKRLSEWIHCICVVTFDLELGQAMEVCKLQKCNHSINPATALYVPALQMAILISALSVAAAASGQLMILVTRANRISFQVVYPSHVELSEKEKLNICYLAFPDSNSGCMGDTQFHIRLRVAPGTKNTLLNAELQRFSLQCVTVQRPDLGHYWGYVYFRQTKDASLPRGYFQKVRSHSTRSLRLMIHNCISLFSQSVILLSRLPFTNLFYEICALIAPKYFANGESVLESACNDISNWPSLMAGECIQLPLLGTVYQTYIPSLTSANLQQMHPQQYNNACTEKEMAVTAKVAANVQSSAVQENDANVNDAKNNREELDSSGDDDESTNNGSKSNQSTCTVNTVNNAELSRDDILDNYKQSKELLARKMAAAKMADKSMSTSTDLYDDNDDDENCGTNDDDDSFSDTKVNATANTQNKSDTISSSSSSSITAAIPFQMSQPPQQAAQTPIVLSSVHEIDIFRSLCTVLSYTHLLWELVLTAEPIVVMATSPSDCSHMVQSLIR